jgi:membrane protease YdiL (CAAX protease family)
MTNLATAGLLDRERSDQIVAETGGEPLVVEFTPTKETTRGQISCVLAGQASVAAAKAVQPIQTTAAGAVTSPGSISWRDLFFILLKAYLGLTIFCFLFGLVGGLLYLAMGYGTDLDAFSAAAAKNFYVSQISVASFYLALLLAMRRVLRKRRGRGSFAGYFRPIGGRRLLYAALSGLVWCGVVLLLLSVFWSTMHWQYHPAAAGAIAHSQSIGRLATLGTIVIVLAPLTEEIYFRGLLLEWFQQKLAPLPSALINAAIFALCHLRFLQYPGIVGWGTTAAIAGQGLLCALWAQRTRSLRAPAAAHATYNATLMFVAFFCH